MKTNHGFSIAVALFMCFAVNAVEKAECPDWADGKLMESKWSADQARVLDVPPEWTYDYWVSMDPSVPHLDVLKEHAEMGAQANIIRVMDYHYVRYRSDRGALYDPYLEELGFEDYTKSAVEACHANGMKAFGYLIPYRSHLADDHPEWRMLRGNGHPVDDHGPCLDFLSPWGEELLARCWEMQGKYGVDAFWLDSFIYQWDGGMRGEYAVAQYKKDTGRELPESHDMADENYRRWIFWRGDILAEYLTNMQRELRADGADTAVFVNALRYMMWPHNQVWSYEAVERVADVPCAEYSWHLGRDPLHKRFIFARLRGIRGDRPAMSWMIPNMHNYEDMSPPAPLSELYSRVYQCLVQRIAVEFYSPLLSRKHGKEVVDNIKKRAPFLKKAQDVKWAALVVGEHDDVFYSLTERVTDYRHNYEEIYRILCEMHVPVDVVSENDVTPEMLEKYSVVVLPGQHCLSDASVENLTDYVANGGGLVATDMTSRWDEWANPRGNFGLSELFGCDYVGAGNLDESGKGLRLLSVDAQSPLFSGDRISDCFINDEISNRGGVVTLKDLGAKNGGRVRYSDFDFQGHTLLSLRGCPGRILETKAHDGVKSSAWLLDEKMKPAFPAVYANTFGKGKVVYFPMNMGGMYGESSYPQWRLLVDQACRHAARTIPSMEAEAPLAVQFEATFQPEENRYVLHLLNDHLQHLVSAGKEKRVRQDLPLVAGIKVKLRGIKVEEVYAEPGHKKLSFEQQGDEVVIEVPPLADHMMVVIPQRQSML